MAEKVLVQGSLLAEDELDFEYKERKKSRLKKSIPIDSQIPEGWNLLREFKTVKHICKDKKLSRQLEDKVWMLFFELGADKISSAGFSILIRDVDKVKKTKQIDVLAIDDDIVFVIECKTRETLGKKSLRKDIAELSGNKKRIGNSLRRLIGVRSLKFVHIIATENIIWADNDKIDADDAGFICWDEYDLMALQDLANLAGEGAKYQIYNRIFLGKKIKGFELKVPALESKMGGHTYYTLVLAPEDLLKIAFVHHRSSESSFLRLSDSYQRMLKKSRLRKIESFIKDGGFFPGAIIVNFQRKLHKKEILGDKKHIEQLKQNVRPVAITLPPYYGCAWIVDGQHRLYGYADTHEKFSETLPVVAFVDEDISLEAKMFVDINKNQKSIEANLLWDLYEDLYIDSKVDKELELYAISRIAKNLNQLDSSPFRNQIYIPKEQNDGNLTLTSVCTTIQRHKLISKGEGLLFNGTYQESIEFATERICAFYNLIKEELEEEWQAGDDHYIRTNAGFVVLTGILRDIVECNLSKSELQSIKSYRSAIFKFLEPLIIHLLDADEDKINAYRGAGGASQKSRQVRLELSRIIRDANIGFRSIWLEKFEESLRSEDRFEKRRKGVNYYIDREESETLEFKGSVGLDIDRYLLGDGKFEISSELPDEGVLKTIVAFLNTKGGDVLVGILEKMRYEKVFEDKLSDCPMINSKIAYGVDSEYGKDEWDGYYQKLLNFIENRISPYVLDADLVEISRLNLEEKDLCLITVKPADSKQYLCNKFFIRRGNKTVLLEGPEIDMYWSLKK